MTTAAPTELAKQKLALMRYHFDVINAWDFAAAREMFHPDITIELSWTIEPFPKIISGIENVMAFMESVPQFAEAENLHDISIHAFADDPNELYAEFKSDMKLVSGREYKNDYLARATVKDGKLIRFIEWPDPIRLLVAMGGSINLPADFGAHIVHSAND